MKDVTNKVAGQIQIIDRIVDQVLQHVRGNAWNQVGDQVGSRVWEQIRWQLVTAVDNQIKDHLWGKFRSK